MGCTHEWGQLLSKHVDGEATPEETALIEEHLRGCGECRDLLSLFRRNESVLDNALTGEAFGSQVVEAVMEEIRRQEVPTVIAPEVEEEKPGVWARARAWAMPIATAAAVLLAVAAMALPRGADADLQERIALLEKERETFQKGVFAARSLNQATLEPLALYIDELRRELQTERAARMAPMDQTVGIMHANRGIQVTVNVRDMSIFKGFDLQRSPAGKGAWETVATGLVTPRHTDATATRDVAYDYRFVGHKREGGTAEMAPVLNLRLPSSETADRANIVSIDFVAATPKGDEATFRLSRWVDGQERAVFVKVRPGAMIGERVYEGDREVDYSTGLMLDRLAEADEVDFVIGGTSISRVNVRAELRRVSGSGATTQLFRGSSTWGPAR